MVKEIEANLRFSIFGKNSKWLSFLGRGNFFGKLPRVHWSETLWVENFDEITLSHTVKEIEANLCFFHFWQKFEMAVIFGERKIFLKIFNGTFLRYPVGRSF